MVNRVQLYARTASGKGFLQYLRIPFRSPTHIRGVCSGASKVWISDYYYSGSDAEFWRKFNARIVDYDEIYGAQDDPRKNTLGMKLGHERFVSDPKDPQLWQPHFGNGLKYFNVSFTKVGAHALAGFVSGSETTGHLFDPNFGQFDIGQGHYAKWSDLWVDLWEYYGIANVIIFTAEMAEVIALD